MSILLWLVVLRVDLEPALGVETDGADLGGFSADDDVTAVAALPDADTALAEDLGGLHVVQQGTVAFLVVLLDGRDGPELLGQLVESLLVGFAGELVIHVRPLVVLAFGGVQQVFGGRAHAAQMVEPELGVFALVVGSLQEEGGNLLVAVPLGHGGVVGVFVAGHALAGKSGLQVLLRARAGILACTRGRIGFHNNLLEIRSGMFADGTDEVLRKFIAYILVAADDTAPDGLALGGLPHRLRLRLDVLHVVAIRGGRYLVEHFRFCDGPDEEDVRTEIDDLLHLDGDVGVGAAGDGHSAVRDTAAILEVGELIDLATALEAKMLEQLEVGGLTDDGSGEPARTLNEFGGQIALVEGHGDAVGLHSHLRDGVADTAVVAAAVTRGDDEQAILDVEKGIAHNNIRIFESAKILILRFPQPKSTGRFS